MSTLALSAAALVPAWYAVTALAADQPHPTGAPQAPAAAASAASAAPKLYTVPEDGAPSDDLPAASRLVRDLTTAHPGEDLVICIAGCRQGDRVVYAQPAEPIVKKPAVAEAAPAAPAAAQSNAPKPVAAETVPATSPKAATEVKTLNPSDDAKPAIAGGGTDTSPTAGAAADTGDVKATMEPTAAEPETQPAGSDAPAAQDQNPEAGTPESSGDKPATDEPSEAPSSEVSE
ncbi:MAG: hypothetical protein ABL907_12810 [Hyphomicrobium sp.]